MSGYDTLNFGYIASGDDEIASFLRNTQGLVNIRDSSLAPSAGDALIATSSTEASWAPIPPTTAALSAVLGVGNTTGANNIVVQQQLQMPIAAPVGTTNLLNVTSGAGVPTSAGVRDGSLYFDTTGNALYVFDSGSGWILPTAAPGTTPTIAQVLTAGSTTTAGQIITMDTGMKVATEGLRDANGNKTFKILPAVAGKTSSVNAYVDSGIVGISASDPNAALDVDLDISPQLDGDVNFITTSAGQVHTNSFFHSDLQTYSGGGSITALSIPPGGDPVQLIAAGGFTRLQLASVFADVNVDSTATVDLVNNRIDLPAGDSTWLITATAVFQETVNHTNSINQLTEIRLVLGATNIALATQLTYFPSSSNAYTVNISAIARVSGVGPNRVYVDHTNSSNAEVGVNTYRLQAARIN